MHSLFFGGISQYYYNGSTLIQDDTCPFVKTISRVTRHGDGNLTEHNFPVEMPNLKGSGAEFIPNKNLAHYENEVLKLNEISGNEIILGHLYGGILSSSKSAFTNNQTNLTAADPTIYKVKLVFNPNLSVNNVDGKNPFQFTITPNPAVEDKVRISFYLDTIADLDYFITSIEGRLLDEGQIIKTKLGENSFDLSLKNANEKIVLITFVLDNKFYNTQKVIKN
jgi:hypothetical protein